MLPLGPIQSETKVGRQDGFIITYNYKGRLYSTHSTQQSVLLFCAGYCKYGAVYGIRLYTVGVWLWVAPKVVRAHRSVVTELWYWGRRGGAVRQWKRNAARGMTFWSRRASPSCIWTDTFIGRCKDG